jgi:hypothetical protein
MAYLDKHTARIARDHGQGEANGWADRVLQGALQEFSHQAFYVPTTTKGDK